MPRKIIPRRNQLYDDGYNEGVYAAQVNIEIDPKELEEALENDELGDIVNQIREHQVQMAGDISYDVGRPGGPTERQYEIWEEYFYKGFYDTVKEYFRKRRR